MLMGYLLNVAFDTSKVIPFSIYVGNDEEIMQLMGSLYRNKK